jgi:hypothetical protein
MEGSSPQRLWEDLEGASSEIRKVSLSTVSKSHLINMTTGALSAARLAISSKAVCSKPRAPSLKRIQDLLLRSKL